MSTDHGDDHLQTLASDALPCDKKDIVVLDKSETKGDDVWTWTVQCDDKQYSCSVEPYTDTECSEK